MRHLALLTALALSPAARADEAGDAVLAQMDEALNAAGDLSFTYDVVHQEPKGDPRTLKFTVQVKGDARRTEFLAPADQKGTRILILSRTQMYIWLPQFKKLRRVASHTTEQGFMGTTLEYDDMSTTRYGALYTATVAEETDSTWVLAATARPDAEVSYKDLRITVDRALKLPTQIDFLDSKGEVARTDTRSGYECDAGVCAFSTMRMTDHTRNGTWTELRRAEWSHDQGLDDSLFTVRSLQRGD